MMLIDNKFVFNIPTHIRFTLYKFDYIDSIIISRVLKECKNWNTVNDSFYTIKVDSFKSAVLGNKKLKAEIERTKIHGLVPSPGLKPNSISFLWSIIERFTNLDWLTFDISYDKKFTRLIKTEVGEVQSFYFKIDEGIFDLTKIFNRESLDMINRKIIQFGIMPNRYVDRSAYFYMKTSLLFEILEQVEIEKALNIFELFDQKLEEDNPVLLVITDYTSY